VEKFRHYLLGHKFIIRTDHKSLKELQALTIQMPKQKAWLAKLLGYDFSIEYRTEKENQGANDLSRAFLTLNSVISLWIPTLQQELQHLRPINEFSETELRSERLHIIKGLWF